MRCLLLLTFLSVEFFASSVHARPVSYPGGWTLMLSHTDEVASAHIHYSPTAKFSLGYRYEERSDEDVSLHLGQLNVLAKRWNKKHSQANFYLKSGLGVADANQSGKRSSRTASFLGVATDWEDRRFFVSYENRYTDMGDYGYFFSQSARAGFAPYVGDYGDLHTWLMLGVQHTPEAEHDVTVMPLIRLFKHVHLLEIGLTNHGDASFRYIFRY